MGVVEIMVRWVGVVEARAKQVYGLKTSNTTCDPRSIVAWQIQKGEELAVAKLTNHII